ncbi:ABC transporter ATP-binding protein [Cryobacterium sp. SO1]|uniref:ABC transporter ATP-binding protein n=1 Tax=Cryobacterium sp. SO1 TaxID=1897061 RepID=UPI00197AFB6E
MTNRADGASSAPGDAAHAATSDAATSQSAAPAAAAPAAAAPAAATAADSAAPAKPARSTTRAPRTPASPRAATTPRAPAKKKPVTQALAEDVAAPPTTPVTPGVDASALSVTSAAAEVDRAEPVAAAPRVPVTRAPAARKTPVKAPSKATRLPATTTATADTADAVEAAAIVDQDLPDGSAQATADRPATAAARSSNARTAASKAAAAKAAAAKSESATKAGAARAAATKAAATKAAAARTAATASARAATAAAAARSAAVEDTTSAAAPVKAGSGVAEPLVHEPVIAAPVRHEPLVAEPVVGEPVVAEPVATQPGGDELAVDESVVDAHTVVLPVAQAAGAPADENVDPPVPADADETAVLTTPTADSDDTVVLTTAPALSSPVTEPARPSRKPFWKLPRLTLRQADTVPPAVAPAEPSEVVAIEESPAAAAPGQTLTGKAPVTAAAPVVMAADAARPATVVPDPGSTGALRVLPVVRKPSVPRTGASDVVGGLAPVEIAVSGLNKRFGQNIAVADVNLEVRAGSFFGIVGPNGAGKTTTLSMITGLLRPDSGSIQVHGVDVWADPIAAKRTIGVLPDRLRLFDRLTGAQLLYYAGVLRGLESETVRARSADLAAAFGIEDALNRLVADYSAGMTKKIALACAMIHSPRVLVLDEPFESVDPVSAVNVTEILQRYVAAGGTVILSSHGMDLIQRVCDHVAIIVQGSVLAAGTIDEVRGNVSLEERFVDLAGGRKVAEGLEWLHNFSD